MNLIQTVLGELLDDQPAYWDTNSAQIITLYQNAPAETQEIIDNIFISLCGWQLKTLIKRTE